MAMPEVSQDKGQKPVDDGCAGCEEKKIRIERLREALEAVMDEFVPDSTKGDENCPITRMAKQALEKET